MSLERCPIHGPYIADRSTDFGETWCPDCGPNPVAKAKTEPVLDALVRGGEEQKAEEEAQ